METSPEEASFAAEFVQIAVRAMGRTGLKESERRVLRAAVAARTHLVADAIDTLIDLALSPSFRAEVTEGELAVFEARFGALAAESLREEERKATALSDFARRFGAEESLLVLDALFAVGAADGRIRAEELARLNHVAEALGVDEALVSALLRKHDPTHAAGDRRFPLRGSRLVIGRAPTADVVLADPLVAARQTELLRVGDGWRVVDLRSGRPTVVNGVAVSSAPFGPSDELRVGPYTLRLQGQHLQVFGVRAFSALSVRQLSRTVEGVPRLVDVSFTVFSGEVVAVVGPSGAGKTTLINAISGVAPADEGEVLLDGQDLAPLLAADPLLVGVVPQEDPVYADLTVRESLEAAARLRLSPDVRPHELNEAVESVLAELDLSAVAEQRIGDAVRRGISGGERRRVNLGQELVGRSTRVLFLDEPTSGLDPRGAQDIVRQIRNLADRGRTVFLVTHDLTPAVMALVDHLLVMAPGGRMIFFGPPAEARSWFQVGTPDALFDRLGDRPPEAWAQRWKASPEARKFVSTREHLLGLGGIRASAQGADGPRHRLSPRVQLSTLLSRYARVKLRDRTGMAVMIAQPLVVAAVLWLVFPRPTLSYAFVLALTALWLGMSASVRELISDKAIWRRERRVGLSTRAWLGSKLMVLAALSGAQCAGLALVSAWAMGLAGEYGFSLPALVGVSVLVGQVGLSMGLLASAFWRSSEAAVGTLPLILIPQIAFAGLLVPLRDMDPIARALTWVTVQRYGFDALVKCGERLARPSRVPGEWEETSIAGHLYEIGFKPAGVADMGLSMGALCGALGLFGLVFLGAAALVHRSGDRRGA